MIIAAGFAALILPLNYELNGNSINIMVFAAGFVVAFAAVVVFNFAFWVIAAVNIHSKRKCIKPKCRQSVFKKVIFSIFPDIFYQCKLSIVNK